MSKLFFSILTSLILMNSSLIVPMKRILERDIPVNDKLIYAARIGRLNEVKELLDHGADINAPDENGTTALMWAAFYGYLEIVNELLNKGAAINARDTNGETALLYAQINEQIDVVKELLKRGAEIPDLNLPIYAGESRKLIEDFYNLKQVLANRAVKPFDVLQQKVNEGNSFHVQYLLNNYRFDVNALKNLLTIAKNNLLKDPFNSKLNEEYKQIRRMLMAKTIISRVSRGGRLEGENLPKLPPEIIERISRRI